MITPPLFDCNVWTGAPDDDRVGQARRPLQMPPDGGINTPAALRTEMDRVGIDRALVYHVQARMNDCQAGNEALMSAIRDAPRLEPCWVIRPSAVHAYGSPSAFTDAMADADVSAVRLFPSGHDYHLTDADAQPLLAALAAADATVLLDARNDRGQGFSYEDVAEVCNRYRAPGVDRPGLEVVITRVSPTMGDFAGLEELVDAVQRTSNLSVETSQFGAHDGLRQFADVCGADRLVFGTHLPHAAAGAGIATVLQSGLTTEQKRQVAGENLRRLLGDSPADWAAAGRAPVRRLQTVPYAIIDIHGHVRDEAPPDESAPDADGIVRGMDRTGIALCCVSQTRGGKSGNDVAARAAERYPDRLIPLAVARPHWDDIKGELARCFDDLGMGIIKVKPYDHDWPGGEDSFTPVWEFANERECLVVTHAVCNDAETEAFTRIAQAHPDMTLMLYHAGRTWDTVDNFIQVAEACPNVLLEITYSYSPDGIIEYLIDQVGVERVFFGTDLGGRAPESQVGWATYARIDEADRRRHMRENALELLDEMDVLPRPYRDEVATDDPASG